MRILFIHPYSIDYPGGAEQWIEEVATRLKRRNYGIGIIHTKQIPHTVRKANRSTVLKEKGIKLYSCPYIHLPRGFPIIIPSCITRVAQYYNIIYLMMYQPNELLMYMLKKLRIVNVPVVLGFHIMLEHQHRLSHRLYMHAFTKICNFANAIHVLNSHHYQLLSQYIKDTKKIHLIPNGVDTSKCPIKRDDEKFRILWTGRLFLDKGADILYEVILRFNEKYPHLAAEVEFIVTGTGPYERHLRNLSRSFSNVKYLGYVDRNTLRHLYAISHLYLAPSRVEGMPLRVLEAFCSGLPVVGSKIPGIIDVVKNVGYGYLVGIGDVDGYTTGILKFFKLWREDSDHYFELRGRIRRIVAIIYDWDSIINKIEKMLKHIGKDDRITKNTSEI